MKYDRQTDDRYKLMLKAQFTFWPDEIIITWHPLIEDHFKVSTS